jgi:hypothetical protein
MGSPFASFRPVSRRGHWSFHSRSALMTSAGTGTVRSPASDLVWSIEPHASARWITEMVPTAKFTSCNLNPLNSEARNPESAAVAKNARR